MTILGNDILQRIVRRNAPLRSWFIRWSAAVEAAIWNDLNDLRRTYPTADGVRLKNGFVVTIFNIKGNNYRLTAIDYDSETVEILDVLTHAEYDKNHWKERYW